MDAIETPKVSDAIETKKVHQPLPDGWKKMRNRNGRCYFVNTKTRRTTWFDPRKKLFQDRDLPEGWEQGYDRYGKIYFIDHLNKKTQRHPPDGVSWPNKQDIFSHFNQQQIKQEHHGSTTHSHSLSIPFKKSQSNQSHDNHLQKGDSQPNYAAPPRQFQSPFETSDIWLLRQQKQHSRSKYDDSFVGGQKNGNLDEERTAHNSRAESDSFPSSQITLTPSCEGSMKRKNEDIFFGSTGNDYHDELLPLPAASPRRRRGSSGSLLSWGSLQSLVSTISRSWSTASTPASVQSSSIQNCAHIDETEQCPQESQSLPRIRRLTFDELHPQELEDDVNTDDDELGRVVCHDL
eukprot:gene9966-2142_t